MTIPPELAERLEINQPVEEPQLRTRAQIHAALRDVRAELRRRRPASPGAEATRAAAEAKRARRRARNLSRG